MGNKNSEAKNIMRTKLSLSLSFHLYDDLELENQISFISSHFLYFVRSEIVNQLIGDVDKMTVLLTQMVFISFSE